MHTTIQTWMLPSKTSLVCQPLEPTGLALGHVGGGNEGEAPHRNLPGLQLWDAAAHARENTAAVNISVQPADRNSMYIIRIIIIIIIITEEEGSGL